MSRKRKNEAIEGGAQSKHSKKKKPGKHLHKRASAVSKKQIKQFNTR
jgi:hypothetical protein